MKELSNSQFNDADLQKIAAMISQQQTVQNQENDEVVIDFMDLFRALWKKAWIILLTAVVFCGFFGMRTKLLVKPTYTAKTLLYVNSNASFGGTKVSISASEITAAQHLVDTYIVILNTRSTLNDVIEQSGLPYTYDEIVGRGMIWASAVNNTEVFSVSVTANDPKDAEILANTIGVVLPKKIASIVEGSSARIVDYAVVPSEKSGPNVRGQAMIGFIFGAFVAAAVIILQKLLDTKIRDTDYLKQKYTTPVLAAIPDLTASSGKNYSQYAVGDKRRQGRKYKKTVLSIEESRKYLGEGLNFASSEAYKLLRTNLSFALPAEKGKCRVIGITSAVAGEAKTTTSINLAYTMAQTNAHVLLVEADMRLPKASQLLNLRQEPGLSNLLAGQCSGNDVLQHAAMMPKLYVCSAGSIPPNPSELIGSSRMSTSIKVFSEYFDVIIIDLPPVNVVSDALLLNGVVDGMLLVVRQGYCEKTALAEAISQHRFAGTKILGFVMTDVATEDKTYYKKQYGGYNRLSAAKKEKRNS